MFSLLTEKQSLELNKAIVQYLIPKFTDSETKSIGSTSVLTNQVSSQSNNGSSTGAGSGINKENLQSAQHDISVLDQISQRLVGLSLNQFMDEVQGDNQQVPSIPSNYLEKKWTTVLRLQKKIFDLESELKDSKATVDSLESALNKRTTTSAMRRGDGSAVDDDGFSKLHWVPSRLKSVLKMHRASVTCVAIHPFKPIMASGSSDGQIIIWNLLDLSEPERIIKNAHTRSVNSLSFQSHEIQLDKLDPNSPQRVLLASGSSDLLVKVWDIDSMMDKSSSSNSLTPIRVLVGHDHIVSSVKFNPENPTLLLSCGRDKSIKVWDVLSGWCNKSFIGHSDWVRSLDITSNGKYVLSCSNDQSVRLSYIESGIGIGLLIGHQQVVETAVFIPMEANKYLDQIAADKLGINLSSDSLLKNPIYEKVGYKYCCSGGRDDMINFWLLPTPLFLQNSSNSPVPSSNPRGLLIMSMRGHSSWIKNLEVHPNGIMLMSCSDDKTLKLWDLTKVSGVDGNSFDCLSVLKSHEGFVNTFQFAPPVISEHGDGSIDDDSDEVDEVTKKMRLVDRGMRCYLISGSSDNSLRIWN